MFPYTLLPTYGRDYKSVAEVKNAFHSNKDFVATAMARSTYVNKQDIKGKYKEVKIRYRNKTRVAIVKVD